MMNMPPFYSASAAPTTIPLDSDYVKLLLHFDEASGTTFADSSQYARSLTAGGVNQYISTAQSKFFGGSLKVDYNSPLAISIPATADFAGGGSTVPWSFSYWIYTVSSPLVGAAPNVLEWVGAGTTFNTQNYSAPINTGRPAYNKGTGQVTAPAAHSNGAWHHIYFGYDPNESAAQRLGVCVGGTNVLSATGTSWATPTMGLNLFGVTAIAGGADGTPNQEVYFAEFLFYVGAVLHPVMGGFTPPALPYSVS